MRRTRRRRFGFTLTEILMAVGILGIGLTMVATVFPVAVDQSRRSQDMTQASLCARSINAVIRARRFKFVDNFRKYFVECAKNATYTAGKDFPAEFGTPDFLTIPGIVDFGTTVNVSAVYTATSIIPRDLRIYNPQSFLYEQGRKYDIDSVYKQYQSTTTSPTIAFWPYWTSGNYIPVMYVTPVTPPDKHSTAVGASSYSNLAGPYRVTIVVYRSKGWDSPSGPPRNKGYKDTDNRIAIPNTSPQRYMVVNLEVGNGGYIIDRRANCGEAYMVDFYDTATNVLRIGPGRTVNGAQGNAELKSSMGWYVLPGAVAVFHTVIGD